MSEPESHWDAGLMGIGDTSHVNAAIQALLHMPPIVEIILNDEEHRLKCRSMLQCMTCSLYELIVKMRKTGMANPSALVTQWKVLSHTLDASSSKRGHRVLLMFLNKLRLEFLQRNADYSVQDYLNSPIGLSFEGSKNIIVNCDQCGDIVETQRFGLVEVPHISQESVEEYFLGGTKKCICCGKFQVHSEKISMTLPPYLIITGNLPCSSLFPLTMNILSTKVQFVSCMIENEAESSFLSLCPDGRVRNFQNELIKNMHLGSLLTSPTMFYNSKITVIYASGKTSTAKKGEILKNRRSQSVKVTGKPKLDCCDLYNDLPEPPRVRDVSTQTEPVPIPQPVPAATPIREGPLISYEMCKTHPKFAFFTGLEEKEFEALYDFIGGEEMIQGLKLNYQTSTPQKARKPKIPLSSKDKLFMFLLRLRRGLPLEELSFVFKTSVPYTSAICYSLTRLVYESFKLLEDKVFISAEAQAKSMPLVMKSFKNLRVILDGASFFIESPTNFQMQGNTFSEYKQHNVLVFIVGVSCQGSTIFCSKGFEGNISDKSAILKSLEFLDRLTPGDCLMVDRGFNITAELLQKGVRVVKPPTKQDGHLNEEEELLTKAVAAARIYVEHAIADIKDNRLLQGTIPLTLLPVLPQLVYIAAFFRNFSGVKIKNRSVVVESVSDS